MKFFVILNNQQEGPYTIAQLAEMGISAETLVWKEGMKDWQPAWTVSELRYILNEKTNEYRNASSTGMQQETTIPPTPPSAPYKEEKKPQNHYLLKIFGGLVLLLLIIMALTNPNRESHENAIRTEVSKAVEKATTSNGNDIFSQGFGMMARMLAGNFIDSALDNLFEYHNYLIFSKGTVTIQDKEHTVSYGIFGKVITMNSDDMVKHWKETTQKIPVLTSTIQVKTLLMKKIWAKAQLMKEIWAKISRRSWKTEPIRLWIRLQTR